MSQTFSPLTFMRGLAPAAPSDRHCAIPPHMQTKLSGGFSRWKKDEFEYRDQRYWQLQNIIDTHKPAIPPAVDACMKHREIYDCDGHPIASSTLKRSEGEPPINEHEVDLAYDHVDNIYRFAAHLTSSGALPENFCLMKKPFKIYVRFDDDHKDGKNFFNAYYDSINNTFVFGYINPKSPDAKYFKSLVLAYDVFGHETGHGLIDSINPLRYVFVSGLLNESIADSIGASAMHFREGVGVTNARHAWLIGANMMQDPNVGLRNMLDPGTGYENYGNLGNDPQPGHIRETLKLIAGKDINLLQVVTDRFGVHILSGLANKPFAEMSLRLNSPSYEKPLIIRLNALKALGKNSSGLVEFARMEEKIANDRYGRSAARAVRSAWATTGVLRDGGRLSLSLESMPDLLNPFG